METEPLAAALEREHIDIDDALAAFAAGPVTRQRDPEPLSRAIRALRRTSTSKRNSCFRRCVKRG